MALDVVLVTELSENVLGEDLAELDTHLVVRVDTPDSALDVDLVLVQSDQGTKRARSELLEHDRVGRLVALENLGLDERGVGRGRAELLSDLLLGLAECEGPVVITSVRVPLPTKLQWTYSGWAKKLERRISWCLPPEIGLSVCTGARKSLYMSVHRPLVSTMATTG